MRPDILVVSVWQRCHPSITSLRPHLYTGLVNSRAPPHLDLASHGVTADAGRKGGGGGGAVEPKKGKKVDPLKMVVAD